MTEKEFAQRLSRRARRAGVGVSSQLAEKLWIYFDLLFRWNAKINLTSFTTDTPDEAVDRLLVEPLVAAKHLKAASVKLIDVGSGGGSPAIPLALASPGVQLVMVESKARKSAFLREALRQLNTPGAVETARFEELLARPDFHENFDVLTVRAVRTEARTLNTLQAFVRPKGEILLFRSRSGVSKPVELFPPLQWKEAIPLVPGSEVAVLEKLLIP